MPPIPVYSDSPIVASKPEGVTPASQEQPSSTNNAPPTTTTTASSNNSTSGYAPAQPPSAAFPAPTAAVLRPGPPPPTRTTQSRTDNDTSGPAPPQPGAVPQAPSQSSASATSTSAGPPPPSSSHAPQQPHQFDIPPPTQNAAPTRSTITSSSPLKDFAATGRGPTTLPLGDAPQIPPPQSQYSGNIPRQSPSQHPAGYVQDPYASEMTAQQRASLDVMEREERRGSAAGIGGGIGAFVSSLTNTASTSSATGTTGEENNVWDAVKGWAAGVGTKAVELEEEVWKRVNGKS